MTLVRAAVGDLHGSRQSAIEGSGGGVREPSAAHFAPVAGGMAFRASERRRYA